MMLRFLLGVLLGFLSACQTTYPVQRLAPCSSAERHLLEVGRPFSLPPPEGPCHRIQWNAQYSFWALPVPESEQWLVAVFWLQYIDEGMVEQAIPLIFQIQDKRPVFLHARPRRFRSFPRFTAQDYALARATAVHDFPHLYFLHSLLVHSLVGDATSFELLQRYGHDFQGALDSLHIRADYERWLALAQAFRPTQPYVEAAYTPPPFQLVLEGDRNLLQWHLPYLSNTSKAFQEANSGQAGFVQQGDDLFAVARWQKAQEQVQVLLSVPIYEGPQQPFSLNETLELAYVYTWNGHAFQGQADRAATILHSSTATTTTAVEQASVFQALMEAEQSYVERQQYPPRAHADQVAASLTHLFYRLNAEPAAARSQWDVWSTQFAHTLRYHPAIANYYRQLQQIVDLKNAPIHCPSC